MALKSRQQMVSAAHVDRQCGFGVFPRASDMRCPGTMINDRGTHLLNRLGDRPRIEQVDRHPARRRSGIWRRAAGTMPGHEVDVLGAEQIEKMAASKPSSSSDDDGSRHAAAEGVTAERR